MGLSREDDGFDHCSYAEDSSWSLNWGYPPWWSEEEEEESPSSWRGWWTILQHYARRSPIEAPYLSGQ